MITGRATVPSFVEDPVHASGGLAQRGFHGGNVEDRPLRLDDEKGQGRPTDETTEAGRIRDS
jgi:hypothetical protein